MRQQILRVVCAVVAVLAASSSFATTNYVSNGTGGGDWSVSTTWSPQGVPVVGDTVTIDYGDTVVVSSPQTISYVTLGISGGSTLRITASGSLAVQSTGSAVTFDQASTGTNRLELDGGTLTTTIGSIDLQGGGSSFAEIRLTANGGTLSVADSITFSGSSPVNGRIVAVGSGNINIGGDLNAGGTVIPGTTTFTFNGVGTQTIAGGYVYHNLSVNKPSGTATLATSINVNGALAITSGILEDDGKQISLNAGNTSTMSIGANGVLKLGNATTATYFPSPIFPSNITFAPNSAVVYHAGVTQSVNAGVTYKRLYIQSTGPAVTHSVSGSMLDVEESLNIFDNGANAVTLEINSSLVDVDGNIDGDGAIHSGNTGAIEVGGNWSAAVDFSTTGTSTVTYDGTGAQSVRGGTYWNLIVNKASGTATLSGTVQVDNDFALNAGTFDTSTHTLSIVGDFTNSGTFSIGGNTVSVGGAFTNSGTFNGGTGSSKLQLNGAVAQTIGGTTAPNVNKLQILNSGGVTMSQSMNVIDLGIDAGKLTTGNNVVSVLSGGSATTTGGWVVGNLYMNPQSGVPMTYIVGTATGYTPVDVVTSGSGGLMVTTIAGAASSATGPNVLQHNWLLSNASGFATATMTFYWNAGDVTGTEGAYVLRSESSGTWQDRGVVDAANHKGTASGIAVGSINGTWTAGEAGSLGSASKLAITSVNGGSSPSVGSPFSVTVQAQADDETPASVVSNTGVALTVATGSGTLGGTTTGTIASGTNSVTITGVTYDTAEAGVKLQADRTSGDLIASGQSSTFNVSAAPSTLTVTSINDSGVGTLRDAITTANNGGCSNPCTIEFGTTGTITLATALPAITFDHLTIDGYTALNAAPNSNAFGTASNAVLTVALDGSNGIPVGLDVQATFFQVRGLAIKNFYNGGSGVGIKMTGDNSGSNISGCYIGTDLSGTVAAPNGIGVLFASSTESSVGGATPDRRNVISGNTNGIGISVDGASNTIGITGNYIGTNATLTAALPNGIGISVGSGTSSVGIGQSGIGNVVSGNSASGISLAGNGATLVANLVGPAGNNSALAFSNSDGIVVTSSGMNNVIGGASPSEINTVSGNIDGIEIEGSNTTVDNNRVGVGPDGTTAQGNSGIGILLKGAAANNTIGTTFGNVVANNNRGIATGITPTGIGNVFRHNKVYANASSGIDLYSDGLTLNDVGDADTGSNNVQNFPAIASAQYSSGAITVAVSLNSASAVSANFYQFDLYKADTSATPQAAEWLGSSGCVAGNVFSNFTFAVSAGTATIGDKIVGTATAYSDALCSTASEGTSELSGATIVTGQIHWIAGSGSWENAGNWSPAIVPTASDDVVIDAGGTYTVTVSSNATANSITHGLASGTDVQTLQVTSGNSLTIASPSTVNARGVLQLDGTSLAGAGSMTVYGTLDWNSGTIGGFTPLDVESGGTLNINSAATHTLSQRMLTIKSGATANWFGGTLNLLSAAGIDNYGTFEVLAGGTINDAGSDAGFDNFGTFRKSGSAATAAFTNVNFNHMGGTVDIDMGALDLGAGNAQAAFTIDSGAELLINSDTYLLANGSSVSGLGSLHVTTGGTLDVGGASVAVDHLTFDGGTISGSGQLATGTNGVFDWTGGTMQGSGTTYIDSFGTLNITGPTSKFLHRTLSTNGTATVYFSGTGPLRLANSGNIVNNGTFQLNDPISFMNDGAAGPIANGGILRSTSPAITVVSNVAITNSGTFDIDAGTIDIAALTNSGSILLDGTLYVDGDTVNLNSGTNIGGTSGAIHVNGGTLAVNANVTVPAVQFDSGTINGSGNLTPSAVMWTGGTMGGNGTTTIPSGVTLWMAGTTAKTLSSRTLRVDAGGSVMYADAGNFNITSAGNVDNAGLFEITGQGSIVNTGASGAFANSGTLRRSTGFSTIVFNGQSITNTGTIDIATGPLDIATMTSSGTITTTGALLINSDTVTLTGGSITGAGGVTVAGGTLTVNTNVTIPNLTLDSGTIDGSGMLTLTGTASWNGGTMGGSGFGSTVVGSGATLALTGSTTKLLNNRALTVNSGGSVTVSGGGTLNMQSSGALITNNGAWVFTTGASIINLGSAAGFANNNTFTKSTSTGTTTITVPFTNTSLVDLQAGSLSVSSFTQSAGTLKLRLGGTVAGSQFSQLIASSAPSLAGTLQIVFAPAYEPVGGDTFRALSIAGGAHAGDFSSYVYPALSGGRTFSNAWDANGLLLSVSGTADLSIAKSAPANVVLGSPIAYTLTVNNASSDAATGVTVTDTLPAGHSSITASGTGWNCTVVGSTATCTATGALATGNANAITINANAPTTAQTMTNTATVSSSNDPNNTNDSGSAVVVVDASAADIWIGGTAPAGPVTSGSPVTFTFAVNNDGPQTATNVVFSVDIPSTVTFNSATIGASTCTLSGLTITCPGVTINATQSATATINLTVNATGTQIVKAQAVAAEADPDTSDNSASQQVAVSGNAITVVNANNSGSGSLRQALLDALSGTCTAPCSIGFNLGVGPYKISPLSDLPPVAASTTLDATTQPGYTTTPKIEIDGSLLNTSFANLNLQNDVVVRGLAITNGNNGIVVNGNNSVVEACFVGITPAGLGAGNVKGIRVAADNATIGGTTAAKRNVISGNSIAGIYIDTRNATNVVGNSIGTNATGTGAIANAIGIEISGDPTNTTIGGATAAHRNIISGNGTAGIHAAGSTTGATNTLIQNNWIGPDVNGTAAFGATTGIALDALVADTIISNNVISGHGTGIDLASATVTNTKVRSNIIGLRPDGTTPMGNSGNGISITNAVSSEIGSTGNGNTIASNAGAGVSISGASAIANVVNGNSIFNNSSIGIDLGANSSTPNDAGDADSGPNNLQNFPSLVSAQVASGNLNVAFTFDSTGGSVLVELFKADSVASGEGMLFLGRQCFPGTSLNTMMSVAGAPVANGNGIVATATTYSDPGCATVLAGTSEFSPAVTVAACTPPAVTMTAPASVCASSTGNAASINAPSATSITWSITGGTITGGQGTSAITFSANASGSVTLTATVGDGVGCTNSDSRTFAINPPPAISITGPANACGSATLTATPGFTSYQWSHGPTTANVSVTTSGTYTVTGTNASGCTATASHTITVNAGTPATITASGPTTFCTGGSVTLTANAGTSYLWSNSATTQSITVTSGGSYSVQVTDGAGCTATSAPVTVTVNPVPTATITASGPTTFCAGGSVTLTASAGSSYLWSNSATTQSITVTSGGSYSVTVSNGSCSATSAPTSVTVNPAPVVTISGPAATCAGAPVTLDAGAGFASYAWSTSETTRFITVTPSATTTYTVNVTNGSGCSSGASHTVTVTSAPAPTITTAPGACPGSTGNTASVPAQGGATYAWTITNGTITSAANTNAITYTAGTSGSVTLSVTVTNGSCTSSGSTAVPISAAPPVNITAPTTANENATGLQASVAAQTGAIYSWSILNGTITSGATSNAITFNAGSAGTTKLTVSVTINSCTATGVRNITVNAPSAQSADVSLVKTAPSNVQGGASIVYTLIASNAGPDAAPAVFVQDTLPSNVTFAGVSGGAFQCNPQSAGIFCSGSLAAGATNTITITVTAPQQNATITNTATIDGGVADPQSGNNFASATTVVTAQQQTSCTTTPPSLLAPAANASVASPVTFSWSPVENASEYELWIDQSLAGVTSTLSMTKPLASASHEWYVVARFASNCTPVVSAARTFTVAPSTTCGNNAAPVLTAPSGGVATSPVTFSWSPVPQAIGYRVWIEVNGTAAQEVGSTDGAISLSANIPAGAIVAYVDALFSGCPTTRSARVAFTVAAPDPCANRGTALPVQPANNATINSSSVDLQWSAANDADGYRIWASIDGAAPVVLGETTGELSLRTTISRGRVEWWVSALYEGCASTESQHFVFTIPQRGDCNGPAPNAQSPSNVTVGNADVTFNWTPVPQAVSYEVWLSVDGGTPTLIGNTTSTSLTESVAPGRLSWYVVATVTGCAPRQSQTATFSYTPPANCATNVRAAAIAPLANATVTAPVSFAWTAPAGATKYELFIVRNGSTTLAATTNTNAASNVALATGKMRWFVRTHFAAGCAPLDSAEEKLEVVPTPAACADLEPPQIASIGQISSGVPFLVQWNEVPGATSYQLQLASSSSFADAQVIATSDAQHPLTRSNSGNAPLAIYARVRAIDSRCQSANVTAYGAPSAIFILPAIGTEVAAPLSGGVVTQQIVLGSELAGQSFVASVKEPWLTVSPASGTVAAGGTTLIVTANTTNLPLGTSLGAVRVTLNSSARGVSANATTLNVSTISVGKASPVLPTPKSTPPPDALIIPAVAHADGINSKFQSDVRVTNSSAQLINYQVTFTPTGGAGNSTGRQTQFSIDPGRTIALDDVLKSWFGTGGASVTGTLEVRPLTQTATSTSSNALSGLANLVTFASSRTFNVTSNGTFGQYIPAIPFANFIGKSSDVAKNATLSLQQIAQSDRYRTNLGIVEGSGEPASLLVRVFANSGQKLTEFPVNLAGGQHTQLNSFITAQGIGPVTDGRIEVSVVGGSGKVTAYASVLDNETSDPLLVTPVTLGENGANRWVVPGVADLDNGTANWQTDLRVFNAGSSDVETTLTFYSQNGGTPRTANVTIPAGQVKQFDRTLSNVFGATNDGGAVHITTSNSARLIATARTYNQTSKGTYGQFISAVTTSEAAGVGSRPLQLLQVEESDRFRSNIGLAEVTGNAVRLEVSIVPPDAKFTAVTEVTLQPNEFRQLNSLLRSAGLGETYNARVTVRAIEGNGRVTAYASVIDMQTNDPTYVPAQ